MTSAPPLGAPPQRSATDSVHRVNRRLMTILLTLVAASLTAGCTTFSDAVARVGDQELSADELDQRLLDIGASEEDLGGVLPGEPVRQVISAWIQETAIGLDDDDISALYSEGIEAVGVACPVVLATATIAEAQDAFDRLEAGEEFDVVFGEANVDPQLATVTGRVGCLTIDQFPPDTRESPDIASLFALSSDNPYALVDTAAAAADTGLVVGYRPFDDLNADELAGVLAVARSTAAADVALDDLDIHVDSRYGTFDPATSSVIPLG